MPETLVSNKLCVWDLIIPPAFMPTGIQFSLFHLSIHMFVSSFVCYKFVCNSGMFMEFMSKFLLKFHWWCISHEPMIRNHSYFNHRYPIGFAMFPSVRTLGPCPEVGLEVKI